MEEMASEEASANLRLEEEENKEDNYLSEAIASINKGKK
jgi:hypothetical protein